MQKKVAPARDNILAVLQSLSSTPVAFEALWDGDSDGWFVRFCAVTSDDRSHQLGILSSGGELSAINRLVSGQVPAWPQSVVAQQLGDELAARYGVEFYFPSPNYPEDDCPDWNNRDKGYPCRRCGLPLLQREPCPWRGVCFHCHLDEEREKKEAQWTPEQRASVRCHICGNPAVGELNGGPMCADCLDKYEVYNCQQCGISIMTSKSRERISVCSHCEMQNAIGLLTDSQRNTIREATMKGRLNGARAAMDVMGCSLYDARLAVLLLTEHEPEE